MPRIIVCEGCKEAHWEDRPCPKCDPLKVEDMAMLIRRLSYSLKRTKQNTDLADRAMDYLKKYGLEGSPLRDETPGA